MPSSPSDLTRSTLRGATMLMSSQGLSRLLTFVGNVLLVRSMNNNPAPLGVSSTQFHLLYIAGISFTREGLRRACLRFLSPEIKSCEDSQLRIAISLAKAYSCLSLMVFLPAALAYLVYREEEEEDGYLFALGLVFLGSACEVLAEPLYLISQTLQWFKVRSAIATLQSLVRVFTGLLLSVLLGWELKAFAAGYFMGGLAMLLAYLVVLRKEAANLVLTPIASFRLDTELGRLAKLTTIQSSWKVLLSEGESLLLLTTVSSAENRGAFAIAAGLGSIAARLILQPCEEAAFTLFGKLDSVLDLFPVLLRAAQVFGGFFACLGVNYTQTLVSMLYGPTLTEQTATWVSWYCVFIAVCAVNGISEALLQAKIDEKETKEFNLWLLACSVLFLMLANFWLVPLLGSGGLIVANTLVMGIRIARNLQFALSHVDGLRAEHLIVPWPVAVGFIMSFVLTKYSSTEFSQVTHVGLGCVLGLIQLGLVWALDKELVATLGSSRGGKEKLT
ncbi:hypothetical protein BASA81_005331 [Batrachochytrium salamandrivorans]|nr:hypothetical protein BASA81_005331 [Batrachochytrium salamandrivorans]